METNRTKKIIEGFDEDFVEIVSNFPEKYPALRLKEFFEYWNETSMDCLFANRFDPRELLEAILEINQLLVRIITDFSEQYDVKAKLIALYLIFCIFIKQPPRLRRKIRLTCNDVICIQRLSIGDSQIDSDSNFVWKQLRTLEAIDIVEERSIYGPSMLFNHKGTRDEFVEKQQTDPILESQKDAIDFLSAKIEPNLAEIESICTPYEHIKDMLKLDEYKDSTVDIQTNGTIREFVDQARSLLSNFKAEFTEK